MKTLIYISFFTFLAPFLLAVKSDPIQIDLKDFRWKNRVIVVFANDLSGDDYLKFRQQVMEDSAGVVDRDLVIVTMTKSAGCFLNSELISKKSADRIRKDLNGENVERRTVLIGKDGGMKMNRDEIVDLPVINSIIDKMPMRRQEMRQSGSQ